MTSYKPDQPHEYVLASFRNILNAFPAQVLEVGTTICIPRFEQVILEDLCSCVVQHLMSQKILLELTGEVIVIGDLHGNLNDLLRIFSINGFPPYKTYLFLGDYVDRGQFSLEVITILFALALNFPNHIYLIRGNHEFETMNSQYGFSQSLTGDTYTESLLPNFQEAFSWLPLAAVINNEIFCVHGGLSPKLESLDDIRCLSRPIRDYSESIVSDLVWSDPSITEVEFVPSLRGTGFRFGIPQILDFFEKTGIKAVFRAHQCVGQGVERLAHTNLYTVFSCSNYCGTTNNFLGYVVVDSMGYRFYKLSPLQPLMRYKASFIRVPVLFIPEVLITPLNLSKFKAKESKMQGSPSLGCSDLSQQISSLKEPDVSPLTKTIKCSASIDGLEKLTEQEVQDANPIIPIEITFENNQLTPDGCSILSPDFHKKNLGQCSFMSVGPRKNRMTNSMQFTIGINRRKNRMKKITSLKILPNLETNPC